jgi:cysteine desulfurase
MQRVYADYNATTPLDPQVLEAMLPYLREHFGNASSVHTFGREARAAIDDVRVRLAKLLGAQEGEVVFTGSGTEADNMAIFGVVRARRKQGRHVITSSIEHHAVLHACRYLEKTGECEVTYLPVSRECLVDPADLRQAIRGDTVLVSIMSANNETGTIQPVKELAAICREHGVTFHTDAVQSFGKELINVNDWGADLLSLAAHKFYGPKGVGALYVRRGTKLDPLLFGGSHENDRRAGTENVAAIVGMAWAAELVTAQMAEERARLFELTEKFGDSVTQRIRGAHRNGHARQRIGNTINFSFEGCEEEGLLLGLDLEGVAASSGSACAVGSLEPSHVLKAMGLPHELARAAVRFSFGKANTTENANYILKALDRVVERLRAFVFKP